MSVHVVVYIRKKDANILGRKKSTYYRAFRYKRRKLSTIVHMEKNEKEKKKKAVFP